MNFNKKNTLIIFDKYLKKNNINNYCIPKFYELKTSNNVFFDFDLNYPLILRSSVNKEDGIFSYSGIFESYYPIDSKEEILKYYKKIMDYNNDNFLFYKKINKIKQDNYIMKPILQEFIIGEYSFVVNTNFKNKYIRIESSPGINKNITDGGKELFILLINKDTLSISIESFIKNNVFYTIEDNKLCSKNFNTCKFELDFYLFYLKNIIELTLIVEKQFGKTQIIEGTGIGEKIYVLQIKKSLK